MSVSNALLLGSTVLVLLYGIIIYNGLVALRHMVAKAWSNIDVLLKQRHDELPKLVEVCRQYRDFERDTLVRVTEARSRVAEARAAHDLPALDNAEEALRGGIERIFVLAEAYPELRANEHFMQLQVRITALENAIADRREWYNDAVNNLNTRIEQFPDLIIARLFGYAAQRLLNFAAAEKADVSIGRLFDDR